MKLKVHILFSALLLSMIAGCKKTDDPAHNQENQAIEISKTDTISHDTAIGQASSSTNDQIGDAQRKSFKQSATKKPLTQHQLDSIKTERGALVTPLENVGPSLTPGSGMAVPSNTKTGPGNNANMGSSRGTE